MQTYQDLFITLNGMTISDFIGRCDEVSGTHWRHTQEREAIFDRDEGEAFAYEYDDGSDERKAGLSLFHKENDIWYVPNIVPLGKSSLSVTEYNGLLNSFYRNVVCPAISETAVTAEVTSDIETMESLAGEQIAERLQRFSSLANKATLGSHHYDRERFFDFIFSCVQKDVNIPEDLLAYTLMEQGWSPDAARELIKFFQFGVDLLKFEWGPQS